MTADGVPLSEWIELGTQGGSFALCRLKVPGLVVAAELEAKADEYERNGERIRAEALRDRAAAIRVAARGTVRA